MSLESVKLKCLSENEPLSRHTSFKIGGRARYFARPETEEELREVIEFSVSEKLLWHVIGSGCNILFSDEEFAGTIISTSHLINSADSVDGVRLTVPAGITIPRLGRLCRECGLSGLEFLSQIPGTVGGAAVMNAGFSRSGDRNQCVGSFIEEVRVLTNGGEVQTLRRSDLKFHYRQSNLQEYAVMGVTFLLKIGDKDEIEEEMKQNYRYRISVQDLRHPSAGSVFKNPDGVQLTVGRMVQNLGLRGKRIGDAQISEIHGNWILNLGNARASEVLELAAFIRDQVLHYYGVKLDMEIKTIGCHI